MFCDEIIQSFEFIKRPRQGLAGNTFPSHFSECFFVSADRVIFKLFAWGVWSYPVSNELSIDHPLHPISPWVEDHTPASPLPLTTTPTPTPHRSLCPVTMAPQTEETSLGVITVKGKRWQKVATMRIDDSKWSQLRLCLRTSPSTVCSADMNHIGSWSSQRVLTGECSLFNLWLNIYRHIETRN